MVADRTFGCGNDAQAWEVDRKGHVAADLRTAQAQVPSSESSPS